jgi:hypothetical protein
MEFTVNVLAFFSWNKKHLNQQLHYPYVYKQKYMYLGLLGLNTQKCVAELKKYQNPKQICLILTE